MRGAIGLMAVLAAACTGSGAPSAPGDEPRAAETRPAPLELAVVESCSAENGVYRLTAERLSDGTLACSVEPLDEEGPTYSGEDCAGDVECECTAVYDGMGWDFLWPPGGVPEAECYPLAEPWMPCGCGTRLTFGECG